MATSFLTFGGCDAGQADNRQRLQDAVDALAGAGGGTLVLPPARANYRCAGTVQWRSGVRLLGSVGGNCLVRQDPATRVPLFDLSGTSGAGFEGVQLVGNACDEDPGTRAIALWNEAPCRDVSIRECVITDWGRSCLSLDGVDGLTVTNCRIERARRGGGIVFARAHTSRRVRIERNRIADTQFGNIHAWGHVEDVIVRDNHLERSGWQGGSYRERNVADNITIYADAVNDALTITGNLCLDSGENGIHVGGTNLDVRANTIINPQQYGLLVCNKPYGHPRPSARIDVRDNTIDLRGVASRDARGIGLRNCHDFTLQGNAVRAWRHAIELMSEGEGATLSHGLVAGNMLHCATGVGVRVCGDVAQVRIHANRYAAPVLHDLSHPAQAACFVDNHRLEAEPARCETWVPIPAA